MIYKTLIIVALALLSSCDMPIEIPPKYPEGSMVKLKLGINAIVIDFCGTDFNGIGRYYVNVLTNNGIQRKYVRDYEIEGLAK